MAMAPLRPPAPALALLLLCALAAASSRPPSAGVCEFCDEDRGCAPGLECVAAVCERSDPAAPRCEPSETCAAGEKRLCRRLKKTDTNPDGSVIDRLARKRFFVAKTNQIRKCMDGLRRFRCKNMDRVCKNEFCLMFTVRECRQMRLSKLTHSKRDAEVCCVVVLPLDCHLRRLCRCDRYDYAIHPDDRALVQPPAV